jgi:hypothetical protein
MAITNFAKSAYGAFFVDGTYILAPKLPGQLIRPLRLLISAYTQTGANFGTIKLADDGVPLIGLLIHKQEVVNLIIDFNPIVHQPLTNDFSVILVNFPATQSAAHFTLFYDQH